MTLKSKIKYLVQTPWFIALLLLGIFLLVTGYRYGWDDQHLEIPLLKSLIDPTLYQGDYYVESLKNNFCTYFYIILSKFIKVDQIPSVYFIFFLVSRYFLFFWVYKLWLYIAQDKFKAFSCGLVLILITHIEEFLYRTFSHQEFALAIIFAGIYFFFKNRFLLASLILGIAANFHALYSLFPMLYILFYLLWQVKKHGWPTLVKSGLSFIIASLPFSIWAIHNRLGSVQASTPPPPSEWLSLFLLACPQNFFWPPKIPIKIFLEHLSVLYYYSQPYIFYIALFILNLRFNKKFKENKKAIAFCLTAFSLLIVCLIFTYFYPSQLVLNLNLTRNAQFLLFLLIGFTTIFIIQTIEDNKPAVALMVAILFTLIKFTDIISTLSIVMLFFIYNMIIRADRPKKIIDVLNIGISIIIILACCYGLIYFFHTIQFRFTIRLTLAIISILLLINYFSFYGVKSAHHKTLKKFLVVIPLAVFLVQYTYYRIDRTKEETQGDNSFWRLQRSWEDMQLFVKYHTPKDAIILTPYNMEMGGFRILSERKVVVCYRDCGIIGFDYPSAVEWQKRIKDIETFTITMGGSQKKALINAIDKYHARYIVFMRYWVNFPDNSLFKKIYTNTDFVLFEVTANTTLAPN